MTRYSLCRAWPALLAIAILAWSTGAAAAPKTVVFAACPIYRDTDNGRKSGCWLGDDPASGLRFDVSDASARPWIGRLMLVEGVESGAADVCGGRVLSPVRVSILEQRCPERLIPPEGHPSKPSVLPEDFIKPLYFPPRKKADPPFAQRNFEVFFDLGSDFINYQDSDTVTERAAHYALDSDARSVHVQGFADAAGFDLQGVHYAESAGLGQIRADKVDKILIGYGVAARCIDHRAQPLAPSPTPLRLTGLRRVVITVVP